MPDKFDKEIRSEIMAKVKNQNTKPEILLRKTLWSMKIRGWRKYGKMLPGTPDIFFLKKNWQCL